MSPIVKRRVLLLAIIAAIVLPSEVLLLPVFDGRTGCVRIAEWVTTHPNVRPATLEEIAAFPQAYRVRIVGRLEPETKARLWNAQFQQFQSRHQDLNQAQEDAIKTAAALITPASYSPDYDRSALTLATARLREVLSKQMYGELAVLGAASAPAKTVASWHVSLIDALRNKIRLNAEAPPECECDVRDNDCSGSTNCAGVGCTDGGDDCGIGNVQVCDGVCAE